MSCSGFKSSSVIFQDSSDFQITLLLPSVFFREHAARKTGILTLTPYLHSSPTPISTVFAYLLIAWFPAARCPTVSGYTPVNQKISGKEAAPSMRGSHRPEQTLICSSCFIRSVPLSTRVAFKAATTAEARLH